jgi:very-short-patch-repair endonuclease
MQTAVHQQQAVYDRERDRVLGERGLCVLRFTNQEANHNLAQVFRAILEACQNAKRDTASRSQGSS